MRAKDFLILVIVLVIVLIIMPIITHPIRYVINFLLLACIIILIILYLKKKGTEKYCGHMYNYDQENPHALISGKEISGTVYSENPENVPGLGWIV